MIKKLNRPAHRWWQNFYKTIQRCYACGGPLVERFVKIERRKRHVCVTCTTITYLNPKLVAGLIPILPDGRIVLLTRNIEPAKGLWSYPAGFVELGETLEQAAQRETREEIDIDVVRVRLLGNYSYPEAGVVTIVFTGVVKRGQKPKPMPEAQQVDTFKPNDIPWKKLAFRSVGDALKDYVCQLR